MVNIFGIYFTIEHYFSETIGYQLSDEKPVGLIRVNRNYVMGFVGNDYLFPCDGVITSFNWYCLSMNSVVFCIFEHVIDDGFEIKYRFVTKGICVNDINSLVLTPVINVKKGWSIGYYSNSPSNDSIGKSPCETSCGTHVSKSCTGGGNYVSFLLDDVQPYIYHFNVNFLPFKYTLVRVISEHKSNTGMF